MKGLYSVRRVADHEVIPYLLHFSARRAKRTAGSSRPNETWVVGHPDRWLTKTQLNWAYSPTSYTLTAVYGLGLVLGVALGVNGWVLFSEGGGWLGLASGAAIAVLSIIGLIISLTRPARSAARPRSLSESDIVRIVNPTITAHDSWFELIRSVDRFVGLLQSAEDDRDPISRRVYRELKDALWEAASVPASDAEVYAAHVLPTRGRDAAALVQAYAASLPGYAASLAAESVTAAAPQTRRERRERDA